VRSKGSESLPVADLADGGDAMHFNARFHLLLARLASMRLRPEFALAFVVLIELKRAFVAAVAEDRADAVSPGEH
jgi:hypothetical protein